MIESLGVGMQTVCLHPQSLNSLNEERSQFSRQEPAGASSIRQKHE